MSMIRFLFVTLFLLILTGCVSTLESIVTPGGEKRGLGDHEYDVKPDGSVNVKVHSVYGGPELTIETTEDEEGREVTRVRVSPAGRVTLEELLPLLQ